MPLYPPLSPRQQFHLPVDALHSLYVEESGNPAGRPVIVLHGGPGGSCSPHLRRFFDPQHWRIILFDQRGAGRSRPSACLTDNSTDELVADMEKLRQHLGITRWMLFGGSWGATLALRYASQYPEKVSAMVLRGIFLCRQQDMDWLYRAGGASRVRPEAWARFIAPIPENERHDPLSAWHRLLHQADGPQQQALAGIWAAWEAACSTVLPSEAVAEGFSRQALAMALIESHYFVNQGFLQQWPMPPSQLAGIPGVIIHGRLDLVCPADQALALHQAWPESRLNMVEGAGHSVIEAGIQVALLDAVAEMSRLGDRQQGEER
ncbi:MAG: prolyl aminopeptidase [Alcanivoracaceae bacterium]|nr:prolyl aminopeptidase [Alcanivoracaceae bacterium]